MFADILQALRQERSSFASESEMARVFGVPQRTLNGILRSDHGIGAKTLARILEARPEWVDLLHDNHRDRAAPGSSD